MTHQVNIKVSEEDLRFIDAKAKRYGLSRSSMLKLFALNAELSIDITESLRIPKI
jgi:predicted DNA binding CopG/RHH family protein